MFSIEIQDEFNAFHAVAIPGRGLEPPHRHQWRLRVFMTREPLDSAGMVVDFHLAKQILREILGSLEGRDLNTRLPLGRPATTELIARYIFDQFSARLASLGVIVNSIALCETDGCWAWYTNR